MPRKKSSKQKFKQGVALVPEKPGWFDLNCQVKRKRSTERIQAASYEDALAYRLAKKAALRRQQEGIETGKPVFYLSEVFKMLMKKIEDQVKLGAIDRKTISEVRTRFQRFFFDYPKHLGVEWRTTEDFTAKDFDNYRNYYGITLGRIKGLSSEMRKLKRIFSRMKDEQWISRDLLLDLRDVECPPKQYIKLIPNSDEDWEKVMAWLYKNDLRSHDHCYFLLRTARRPSHVRELLRANVKFEEDHIYVPKEKHKDESWIPINDTELRKVVSRAMDISRKLNSVYLFVNKDGKQFSKSNPLRVFKAAAKACGIANWEQWTPYQLKKKMLTGCFNKNLSAEKIQIVSGHKDLNSVRKHYYSPDKSVSGEVFEASKFKVKQ